MKLLSKIEGFLFDIEMECKHCGYQPSNPYSDFELTNVNKVVTEEGSGKGINEYECPDCNERFVALICQCGRGYYTKGDTNKEIVRGLYADGVRNYKCECGEILLQEYEP